MSFFHKLYEKKDTDVFESVVKYQAGEHYEVSFVKQYGDERPTCIVKTKSPDAWEINVYDNICEIMPPKALCITRTNIQGVITSLSEAGEVAAEIEDYLLGTSHDLDYIL